jgi:hypothetical protein
MDALGHPHAVYADGRPAGASWTDPVDIVHAWHDGTAWQRETIARRAISPGYASQIVRFDMGPEGTLHAAWQALTETQYPTEVASRRGGVWKLSDATAALPAGCGAGGVPGAVAQCLNHWVVGDASGNPHLVVVNWDHTLAHLWMTSSGWSSEAIPTAGAVNVLWADVSTLRVLGGGEGPAVVYQRPNVDSDNTIFTIVRGSAGWSAPAPISALGRPFYLWDAARSLDGKRVAVAAPFAEFQATDGALWIREEDGSVSEKKWFTMPGGFAVGHGPAGSVWVAAGLLPRTADSSPTVVFEEAARR